MCDDATRDAWRVVLTHTCAFLSFFDKSLLHPLVEMSRQKSPFLEKQKFGLDTLTS